MAQQVSTNTFGTAKWIVSSDATQGTHTTIGGALTSASSGDTIAIRPGTYTENLTLKAGVNLTGWGSDSSLNGTGNVIISGTCTLTTAGSVTISGLQLQTNSAALLAVTGSAASIVNLTNCYLNCTNNTGITFSSSNASAQINIYNCGGNLGTTGIAYYAHSSAGNMVILSSRLLNTGASTTANTVSAGGLNYFWVNSASPVTISGTGGCGLRWSSIECTAINTIALTAGGSGTQGCEQCLFTGGSASAVTISTTLNLILCEISSTNTNAITGAGTLTYQGLGFTSTSKTINTTTQSQAGTLFGSTTTAPTAGMLGEQIRSAVASGSPVSIVSSNTPVNMTSISLTAGIWDVSAIAVLNCSGNATVQQLSISTTSATNGSAQGDNNIFLATTAVCTTSNNTLTLPSYRMTLTTTTTVYCVINATFSSGVASGYGRISATRVG